MKISIKREVEVKYLKLDVAVRYEEEHMPNDAPLREGNSWCAIINLHTARIRDWPKGRALSFRNMKVCDEGIYILLDDNGVEVTRIEGYVPNKLLPGAYGDYLSLDIDEDGKITNWLSNPTLENFEEE